MRVNDIKQLVKLDREFHLYIREKDVGTHRGYVTSHDVEGNMVGVKITGGTLFGRVLIVTSEQILDGTYIIDAFKYRRGGRYRYEN